MIVKMNKYTFVVLGSRREEFLADLQKLGMVDVTTRGWEPSEEERALVAQIERHREATEYLGKLAGAKEFSHGEPYDTGAEAFEKYTTAREEIASIDDRTARYVKLLEEVRPWGDYNPERLSELADRGMEVRYFTAPAAEFARLHEGWGEEGVVEEINSVKGTSYFVVMGGAGEVDAQEVHLPDESPAEIEARLEGFASDRKKWESVLASSAATLSDIELEADRLKDTLQFKKTAKGGGEEVAEGALVVMEAWAREMQAPEVDTMLAEYPDVMFIKERPTPDDETPVEIKNSRFASPFEFIGDLYAKPRYGTMDLTRWFAPFFMLFFGMCMGDLGYGTIIFLGGLAVTLASKKEAVKQIGRLTMWCGGAAMVMGFLMGSLFGVSLAEMKLFEPIGSVFISSDVMFYLAIAIGIFHVMFAMVLNIVTTARAFGFRYALANIGWFWVLITCIAAFGLQYLGVKGFGAGESFAPGSIAFWVCFGAGMVLLLFFNSPGKNPLVNFGSGLWGLFNRLTGLLGDALSYIRLFAIGLSGGVLAMVFNRIAMEVSPDIPVVGQIVTLIILLFGHSLNLFMSTLSAIVHPLRLTFVEFYNNAGFEPSERIFKPLKYNKDK